MQPTTVAPVHGEVILNQPIEDAVAHLKALGVKNTEPPLPHSAYLKNQKTGLVLPWTIDLAEQRDLMVNCDANGNTDPVAWASSVIHEPYDALNNAALHQQAISQFAQQTAPPVQPKPVLAQPPAGTQTLEEYAVEKNAQLMDMYESAI